MKKIFTLGLVLFVAWLGTITSAQAQIGQRLKYSQQFRLGSRIIRVAEPGQIADTVSVWGDVNSPGMYMVPVGTTLPQLISYAYGPNTIRNGQTQLDWSKMHVSVNISEYNPKTGEKEYTHFEYQFDHPLPEGMRTFTLESDQVVTVDVQRNPSFVDYVRVIAPIISAIATSIIIIDRL